MRQVRKFCPPKWSNRLINNRKKSFNVLSLPPELRNLVYHYALSMRHTRFDIVHISTRGTGRGRAHSVQALLQTCWQVYNEAIGILYSVNVFGIKILQAKTFLDAMRKERLSAITSIAIHDPYRTPGSLKFLHHFARLPNLETLAIITPPSYNRRQPWKATPQILAKLRKYVVKIPKLRKVRIQTAGRDYPPFFVAAPAHVQLEEDKLQQAFDEAIASKTFE